MRSRRLKSEYVASALVMATLLVTVATIPFKYADAQVLPRNNTGGPLGGGERGTIRDHMSNDMNQKIEELKANHPELGALADKMQSMNATDAVDNLRALQEFTATMMTAVKNLAGNMTGGMVRNMTSTQ